MERRAQNPNFPVADLMDVPNAVQAIGRAPAGERAAIRRFIIMRAEALAAMNLIPATWQSDGSLAAA